MQLDVVGEGEPVQECLSPDNHDNDNGNEDGSEEKIYVCQSFKDTFSGMFSSFCRATASPSAFDKHLQVRNVTFENVLFFMSFHILTLTCQDQSGEPCH